MSWKLFGQIVALMVIAALIMIGMRFVMRPAVYRPMPRGMEGRQIRPGVYPGMQPNMQPAARSKMKPEARPEVQPPAPNK